jgi:hypothetical protein
MPFINGKLIEDVFTSEQRDTYLGLKHGVNADVPAPSPGNYPF